MGAKIEDNIKSEMKIFAQKLQNEYDDGLKELRASNEFKVSKSTDEFQSILKKHEYEIKEIESAHLQSIHKIEDEQQTKIKGLRIKHNLNNNQILKSQKCEIEKLKQNHEEYLVEVQKSMELDIANLTKKQQSDSLQSFKEKNEQMQNEYDVKLEQMRIEYEEKLNDAQLEWQRVFIKSKTMHEVELKEFVNCIENKKIDCLSDKEVTDYKEKYAVDIDQRKEKIKMTMHSEYEAWKKQKKKYYQHCKRKEIEHYENENKILTKTLQQTTNEQTNEFDKEMKQMQAMQNEKIKNLENNFEERMQQINDQHIEKMDELRKNCNQQMMRMQNDMRLREQTKRDELRSEYKAKYEALMSELEAQQLSIDTRIDSNAQLKSQNVLNGKCKELQTENCKLQHQITEFMEKLKQQKILFSKERREFHFKIDGQKNKLLNLQQQIKENEDDQDQQEDDQNEEEEEEENDDSSLYSATFSNSEFVTLQQIETNENNEIPSTASKWSEYLQKEQECIDNMRVQINATKKSLRQKQRKLETMKNGWKKERDKLKLMSMDTSLTDNKLQFNSFKIMLKKKKHEIDNQVNHINEQILEVRDSTHLLNKRESRLQTLEIEYLRVQNKGNDIALNQSNNSVQSIELQQKAYNSHQANMYNVQQRQTKTKTKTMESNEIQQQGIMIHSNSIGQHALKSVISKYVKHNQHTQRTINHHKSC